MRPIKILSVCGSGTVSSAMVSKKIVDFLKDNGYNATTDEANPPSLPTIIGSQKFDLIAATTTISDDYGIPVLNATSLLIGMGEEKFFEDLLELVKSLDLEN